MDKKMLEILNGIVNDFERKGWVVIDTYYTKQESHGYPTTLIANAMGIECFVSAEIQLSGTYYYACDEDFEDVGHPLFATFRNADPPTPDEAMEIIKILKP